MKMLRPKDRQTLAHPTPHLPETTLPVKPVAINSPEFGRLMR